MWIWKCKAIDLEHDKEVEKTFDDSQVLLDCIIETHDEGVHYCLSECLRWCRENHYMFATFELLAE